MANINNAIRTPNDQYVHINTLLFIFGHMSNYGNRGEFNLTALNETFTVFLSMIRYGRVPISLCKYNNLSFLDPKSLLISFHLAKV